MKLKFLFYGLALCAGLALTASCSDDDNKGENKPQEQPTDTPNPPGDPDNMVFAKISGVVSYSDPSSWTGPSPLANVKVTSGSNIATTDGNGFYKLDEVKVENGYAVVKFEAENCLSIVRSIPVEGNSRLNVVMKAVDKETTFTATGGTTITMQTDYWSSNNMVVEVPGGFVTEGKTAYTGTVNAKAAYLNPDDGDFSEQMPGDLATNQGEQLVSYGMVGVEFTGTNGEKLQMAEGNEATLHFPVPNRFATDTENPLPEKIDLWSFNEETGLWEKEGEAEFQGNEYVGKVKHFSWHNLDAPSLKATLKITVKDTNDKPIANVPVDIDGQRTFYTDKDGKIKCEVPSDVKFYVRVASEAYGNYAGYDTSKEKKVTVNKLNGGDTKSIEFKLPAAPAITGVVTNSGSGSNVCMIYIVYNGYDQTDKVMTDLNGAYRIFGPVGYNGPATIYARFSNGDIVSKEFTLDGNDQRIDLQANTTSGSGTGRFNVKNSKLGLNMNYPLPGPKAGGLWTAEVEGGMFSVYGDIHGDGDNGGRVSINFGIQGYDASKTTFNSAYFNYMEEKGPHFGLNISYQKAEVTRDGDVYHIKMTDVDGTYYDQMNGFESVDVKATVEFDAKAAN